MEPRGPGGSDETDVRNDSRSEVDGMARWTTIFLCNHGGFPLLFGPWNAMEDGGYWMGVDQKSTEATGLATGWCLRGTPEYPTHCH